MFKRNKGYFLLTMLVLTGLAGKLHSDTLTTKERHYLASGLKTSRNDFFKSVEGLSSRQLNFRPAKDKPSVKDCIYELVSIENSLWHSTKTFLEKGPSTLQKTFPDDEMVTAVVQKPLSCKKLKFRNTKEALKLYKSIRAEMLRYVHTSTENVRGHVVATSSGNFDAYQCMLLNTLYTNYYVQQIEQIKSARNFPE